MASSRSSHYNYFREKTVLREEEKVLREMLGKFQDQLNRLKIEELALISLSKMQEEQANTSRKVKQKGDCMRSLDSVSDVTSSITSVAAVGLMYENASDLNKEFLDLNVRAQHSQGDQNIEDFEEEEEDEDDCDDEEEEDDDMEDELNDYAFDL